MKLKQGGRKLSEYSQYVNGGPDRGGKRHPAVGNHIRECLGGERLANVEQNTATVTKKGNLMKTVKLLKRFGSCYPEGMKRRTDHSQNWGPKADEGLELGARHHRQDLCASYKGKEDNWQIRNYRSLSQG